MKIPNRKNKPYSSKLFNELLITYFIKRYGFIYDDELKKLTNLSDRTIQRYLSDLAETHVFGKYSSKLQILYTNHDEIETINKKISKKTIKSKQYNFAPEFYIDRNDAYSNAVNKKSELRCIGFCQEHPEGLDSDNQHIVKLTRTMLLMHCVINSIMNRLTDFNVSRYEIDELHFDKELDTEEAKDYYYNELNLKYNQKTFQRDLNIVISVIEFMNDK